jgi:hypothetical protein
MPNKLPDAVVEAMHGLSAEQRAAMETAIVNAYAGVTHGNDGDQSIASRLSTGDIYRNGPANINAAADVSNDTINLVRNAQADIQRSGTTLATGFVGYDLKTPAAMLIPFMTPLLNMTPRQQGVGIDAHHWKAVTDFFGGNGPQSVIGAVDDGGTPQFVSRSVQNMSNTFQTIGLQDSLTFQAEWRARQLEGDLRALLTSQLLYALKLVEENWLINMSDYLWTPPPVLLAAATTGGSLAAATYWVQVTAVNANGETLGSSVVSAAVGGSGSGSLTITIFTVPNAASYNVYVGTGSTQPAASAMWKQVAGNFSSSALPQQPSNPVQGNITATLTSLTSSGTAISSLSANTAMVKKSAANAPLTFQGVQALIYNAVAAQSYVGAGGLKTIVAQPAASTGYLALSDIQNQFLNMFLNARANPECLFVAPQDSITISNLVAANSNTRIVVNADNATSQNNLIAGYRVGKILNETTQRLVEIVPLPYLPQGTIIFGSMTFPYPVSGYNDPPFRVLMNRDYYGVDYPPTPSFPTQNGFGTYVDETLVLEWIGGWGIINGIVYH